MKEHKPDKNDGNVNLLNEALVDELKKMGCIQTPLIEAAFRTVQRHYFLPGTPLEEVYSDQVVLTKQSQDGEWISSSSQPAMMAVMLEQLGLEPGQRILEIGAGTGYNAALMAHIVGESGQVVTIDIDEDLVEAAREHLTVAGFKSVQVVCTDGGYGYADAAPFDRIILTVGALDITPAWWDQLKPYGRLVLPLMLKGSMKSIAFEKVRDHLASISVKECGFMLLRGKFALEPRKEVPIGPDPNLYIETEGELLINPDSVYDLLTGESKDWPANIDVTTWDVLNGNLWTWLALHEPQICKLVAKGDMTERIIVPPLIGIDGKQRSAGTVVQLGESGIVALTRPPGQAIPFLPLDKLFTPEPFPLFIRQYGSDDSLAKRLITRIQEWNAAERPTFDNMRIRAYPKAYDYMPSEDEIVIEKQWTKLIIEWPVSTKP
jgi:protein-L-isoaspartate(D-aspartate) O-methyltransferase